MRFIVTAGPTREYLDDVRFLTNASSGRMGYAVARMAARRGHSVDLLTGPVALRAPSGVRVHRAISTQEMYEAAKKLFPRADCLIGAAAPADFTPVRRIKGKAKKADASLVLQLKPTVDILATLGRAKSRQVIIAFALEVQSPLKNARLKLRRKNADAIVLNSPAAIGAPRSDATILLRSGARLEVKQATKQRLGRILVGLAESLRATARDDGR
ncbi:MAG: phosphopantothenoylcysteine decarboxylase [Candidatus Brocadiia bacterium]|jgi:phosphopantothenoylcysteine synthetase/decarboxylase